MPVDGQGNYRHNTQVARMHGGTAEPKGKRSEINQGPDHNQSGEDVTEVHAHGDGTFHTSHPVHGEIQHETIGHMHAHLSSVHGKPNEKHFHAHNDGESAHSHSVETGGEPEHQDHEVSDNQAMTDHLQQAMGDEPEGPEGEQGVGYDEQHSALGV
jgi:hypothetical protein